MHPRSFLARRRLLGAALALPVAGCVPTPYGTYWRPVVAHAGARDRRAWCQGQAGPVTGVDVDLGGGLALAVVAEAARDGAVPVRVQLALPAGKAVRMPGLPRVVADGRPLEGPVQLSAFRSVPVAAGTWVDPQRLRPGAGPAAALEPEAPFGRARLRIAELPGAASPQLTAAGLRVGFDDRTVDLPAVELARGGARATPDSYRSAQQQAADEARAAACRRDTPQRACDNILDYIGTSHAAVHEGIAWSGRWYRSRSDDGLHAELALAVRQGARWRLEADGFQLRDAAGGAVRPLALTAGSLVFSDRIEPGAPLPAAAVPTTAGLAFTVPADAGSAEFQLAPLLADGEPLALPPVRLERRRFDGGVEPFNC
ncbi:MULTISPECIES: hypothetical protein [Ramlibacter]|uniref:Uncharacterized protein n=1 Tax=Ramlibacter pinisoli TaxID=2682844 RepID=A0A6N8J1G1_9BURK|nr:MULTISPECIES: hypothetical protein [Ramlibacter]MBA2962710.1 hypothetical protein [Ramlibacter sp. CGMCC 1.13660]MVQ32652.1 hypothetical protein [Ramlibacter pinisoli]